MNTLIIYDETGCILDIISGQPAPREPIGVPFLWAEIPKDKQIKITNGIGVDVTKTPHQVVLEDIPPTEMDLLKEENTAIKQTVDSVGQELALEKMKGMQKDTVISNLGQEVGKIKLDIIQLKGSVQ